MTTVKTLIFSTFVLGILSVQGFLVYTRPWWGAEAQFPMTLMRSVTIPTICGVTAILAIFSAKSAVQRNILYLIITASVAEIITVTLMLWFDQSPLIVLILILNAFITFQFLRYGDIALSDGR
jgi:hypothetical protein